MPTALQTPIREGQAEKVGRRRYRKQVLPLGHVDHDGKRLDFTPTYLRQLADSFNDGKMDQVPFILVEGDNSHSQDPEKVRGDVEAMEVASDGLYAVVSLSERGEQLVKDNPKLGVSARINQEDKVIEHVAATVNPVVKGMRGWEALDLSADEDVLDLTDSEFVPTESADSTDDMSGTTLTPEEAKSLKALADALKEKREAGEDLTVEEIGKLLGSEEETEEKPEPVAALSDEAKEAIELAKTEATKATKRADEVAEKLAKSEWKQTRTLLLSKGVPKSMLDKAEPILSKASAVVELSRSDSEASALMQMLHEAEGIIDFSERGSASDEAEDDEKQARDEATDDSKWGVASG